MKIPAYYKLRERVSISAFSWLSVIISLAFGMFAGVVGFLAAQKFAESHPDVTKETVTWTGILLGIDAAFLMFLIPHILDGITQRRLAWERIDRTVSYLRQQNFTEENLSLIDRLAEIDQNGSQSTSLLANLVWAIVVLSIASIGELEANIALLVIGGVLIVALLTIIGAEANNTSIVIRQAIAMYNADKNGVDIYG